MIAKNIQIKLVSIDFVPSWESDKGIKHTVLGQKYIDAKDLPVKLQKELQEICFKAWEHTMEHDERHKE